MAVNVFIGSKGKKKYSTEKALQAAVLKYLNSLPKCVAENVSGGAAQSGRPDINGCFNGKSFRIELKTGNNGYGVTKKQMINLERWAKAGSICGVCYTLDDVRELLGIKEDNDD